MKTIEEFLAQTPKPKVTAPGYRQNLRRDLLNSQRFRTSGTPIYRKAFYLSLGISTVFAAMLVLFILHPAIPSKVHYAFRSDSAKSEPSTKQIESNPREMSMPTYSFARNDARTDNDLPDASIQPYSKDIDEVFVRMLTESHLNKTPIKIEPVAPSELYSINRFRLDDGNDVVVYTQVPASGESF